MMRNADRIIEDLENIAEMGLIMARTIEDKEYWKRQISWIQKQRI